MSPAPRIDAKFEALLDHLKRTRGFDFAAYKRNSLMRRATKRLQAMGIRDFEAYVDYLEVHPEEFSQLFNTVLINVTSFFRDQQPWEFLGREIIPRIIKTDQPGEPVRVWSAGCASGEEAYTIAMLLCEALGPAVFQKRVKIYASDVDDEALAQARSASFMQSQLAPIPEDLRKRYFVPQGNRLVFRNDLRRSVIFGRHDLLQDAPISRLDLLLCRNTLMYLNSEAQGRILARFHFALNDTGFLFLGKAEMLLTQTSLFTPTEIKYRVFTKTPKVSYRDRLLVMAQAGDAEAADHLGRAMRLREAAFEENSIARIVVDVNGVVTLANARMRALFNLEPGDIGRPLQDLEISYRPIDLRSLMDQARVEPKGTVTSKLEVRTTDAGVQYFDVEVSLLAHDGGSPLGYLIAYHDVSGIRAAQADLERSNHELETANEELQSSQEELETTNEELQSSTEELETTNEELQSSNEELETMNEELQSTNEELETMNAELRQRSDELDGANRFLYSILSGFHYGVAVLDSGGAVVVWNQRSEDLWGLRLDEVKGKPFLDLDIGLPVGDLAADIESTMKGAPLRDDIELEAMTRRGRKIRCLVSCSAFSSPSSTGEPGVILVMKPVDDGLEHHHERPGADRRPSLSKRRSKSQ